MAPTVINHDGVWGPVTSTLDWCEANYEVTPLVAEFWNTVSNAAFIIPPAALAFQLYKYHGTQVEMKYILSLCYLALTGIGSLCFHATLKYPMQLWDELCMVWEALLVMYLELIILWPALESRPATKATLLLYGLGVNLAYLFLEEPVFHQVAFGLLAYGLIYLGWRIKCDYKDHVETRLFFAQVFFQHLGFFLWNIDNLFCGRLDSLRRNTLPAAFTPVTQLHAWWHLLMGYGSYITLVYVIQARIGQRSKLAEDRSKVKYQFSNGSTDCLDLSSPLTTELCIRPLMGLSINIYPAQNQFNQCSNGHKVGHPIDGNGDSPSNGHKNGSALESSSPHDDHPTNGSFYHGEHQLRNRTPVPSKPNGHHMQTIIQHSLHNGVHSNCNQCQ